VHSGYRQDHLGVAGPADGEPPVITFERWLSRDADALDTLHAQARANLARVVRLHSRLREWQAELANEVGWPESVEKGIDEDRLAAFPANSQRAAALDAIADALVDPDNPSSQRTATRLSTLENTSSNLK
jgi:hypothetical protein